MGLRPTNLLWPTWLKIRLCVTSPKLAKGQGAKSEQGKFTYGCEKVTEVFVLISTIKESK